MKLDGTMRDIVSIFDSSSRLFKNIRYAPFPSSSRGEEIRSQKDPTRFSYEITRNNSRK